MSLLAPKQGTKPATTTDKAGKKFSQDEYDVDEEGEKTDPNYEDEGDQGDDDNSESSAD